MKPCLRGEIGQARNSGMRVCESYNLDQRLQASTAPYGCAFAVAQKTAWLKGEAKGDPALRPPQNRESKYV